jgi:hypothetical protein
MFWGRHGGPVWGTQKNGDRGRLQAWAARPIF